MAGTLAFDDHVEYTPERVQSVRKAAGENKAEVLATTRKDGVKLGGKDLGLPLWQLEIEMELAEGEAEIVEKIRHACAPKPISPAR